MPKIILSEFVEPELAAIWDYIALDNPGAADDVMDAVLATMQELSRMPGMGRLRRFPQTRLINLRSFGVKGFDNYVIFYSPITDGIEVFHVMHGARDIVMRCLVKSDSASRFTRHPPPQTVDAGNLKAMEAQRPQFDLLKELLPTR